MHPTTPLAERVRPTDLSTYVGQEHVIGKGTPLYNALQNKVLYSCIFWGPPGVGKTTLARIIAQHLDRPFHQLSAINAGVKDVREVIDRAKKSQFLGTGGNAILFIDEIHRFNKSQQDALLGAVEQGIITLIGATTENPSFEVNAALLSRCEVFVLKALSTDDLKHLAQQAVKRDETLSKRKIIFKEWDALLRVSGGDGRRLLNALDIICLHKDSKQLTITDELVLDAVQQKRALFDKGGEQHYDLASAFIKSMRGSDPNAAVYYLARMIEGGEDPKFIARRMLILASEDIGNANPNALLLADACFRAVTTIGLPECRINLSQTAIYLACSPKSNASYMAIKEAQRLVRSTGDLSVPMALRNAPTALMNELGYGQGYQYAHDEQGSFADMEFLPDEISGHTLFQPGDNPREEAMRKQLRELWKERYGY